MVEGTPDTQLRVRDLPLDLSFRDLVDSLEDDFFIINRDYRVQLVNSALMRKLDKDADVPLGKLCYEIFENRSSPCNAPLWLCPLEKVLQGSRPCVIVHAKRAPNSDASRSEYVRISMYPLRDSHGNINAVAELRRDVTAERDMEYQIVKRHHHLQALSRISSATSSLRNLDGMLNICLDIALEAVNGEIGGILLLDEKERMLRYRVYRGLSTRYVQEMRMPVGKGIAGRVAKTGEPILLEDISRDPRAAHRDLVSTEGLKGFTSIPLKAKDKVVGVLNIASHMSSRFSEDDLYLLNSMGCQIGAAIEQARLYERLSSAAKRYQILLQHTLTAQEDERKRIARELHDETSQAITSLTLSLQAVIGMVETKGTVDADVLERLRMVHSYMVRVGNDIVKLMKELRPTLLDELGMPAAIHRYAKDSLQSQGINVSAQFKGTDRRFPPEIEVTLFRVAQGIIGNIMKHSNAKNASISLDCDADRCVLQIEDDGRGFDVTKLTKVDPSGRGAGLFTMKERVKLVGGSCRVESRPGQGTRVTVNIPLPANTGDEKDKGADS